jgi:hypothetical protein
MRTRSKLLLAGMAATLLLSFAVGTASARRLAVDDQDFDIRWAPLSFIAGGTTTTCNVTLLGSFHSLTIAKTAGLLIGFIDHAAVNSCNAGAGATVLTADLPWHVRYSSFAGILPNITSVTLHLVGAAFRVDPAGELPACLARTDATEPGRAIAELSGTNVTGLTADRTQSIDLEDTSFACTIGGDAEFEGRGTVEDLAGNALNISLVA